MESVIPCEPNGSRGSLLSPTDSQQAVDYRDFCYSHRRRVVVEVVTYSWEFRVVVCPNLFSLEDLSTKLSMISYPFLPAPDVLPYVSEWATGSRAVTARIQVGIPVWSDRFGYSED